MAGKARRLMPYDLRLSKAARKFLDKLDPPVREQVWAKVKSLAAEPRPAGAIKLTDQDLYRLRSGEYRILYQIHDRELVVYVVRIGHRREVYDF